MSFGIVTASVAPVREERSKRSGLVTQLLFGELFEEEEWRDGWVRVRTGDGCAGWLEGSAACEVDDAYASDYRECRREVVREVFGLVRREGDWAVRTVPVGSVLPCYDAACGRFRMGGDFYALVSGCGEDDGEDARATLARGAFLYHNTPCVWGGRSLQGIDSPGLVQMAYRLAGVELARSIEGQAAQGETLSFLEEALPGDVAFFGDCGGGLTHAGIVWKEGHIVHVSGRVRVDRLDHNGIFNDETRRYTHSLKLLKRYL